MKNKTNQRTKMMVIIICILLPFLFLTTFGACQLDLWNTADKANQIDEGMTMVSLNVTSPVSLHGNRAPSSSILSWGELIIAGEDMTPITADMSTGSAAIQVPSGDSRVFTLTASAPSVNYFGTVTRDLPPNETVQVTIPMEVLGSKIIVPDTQNNRIVQIDDISGNGWLEYSFGTNEYPVKTGFDYDGFIYALIEYGSHKGIFKTNNFTGANTIWDTVNSNFSTNYSTFTIDRSNGYIYLWDGNNIVPMSPDGTILNDFPLNVSTMGFSPATLYAFNAIDDGLIAIFIRYDTADGSFFDEIRIYQFIPDPQNPSWTTVLKKITDAVQLSTDDTLSQLIGNSPNNIFMSFWSINSLKMLDIIAVDTYSSATPQNLFRTMSLLLTSDPITIITPTAPSFSNDQSNEPNSQPYFAIQTAAGNLVLGVYENNSSRYALYNFDSVMLGALTILDPLSLDQTSFNFSYPLF